MARRVKMPYDIGSDECGGIAWEAWKMRRVIGVIAYPDKQRKSLAWKIFCIVTSSP